MAKSKKKSYRWTIDEEEILVGCVRKYDDCLTQAFEETSKSISRSPGAISQHWYSHTSKHCGHVLFLSISGKRILINRRTGKGNTFGTMLYKKILAFLGLTY